MLKENKINEWIINKIWYNFGILDINDILENWNENSDEVIR